jgi:hypothetical protein
MDWGRERPAEEQFRLQKWHRLTDVAHHPCQAAVPSVITRNWPRVALRPPSSRGSDFGPRKQIAMPAARSARRQRIRRRADVRAERQRCAVERGFVGRDRSKAEPDPDALSRIAAVPPRPSGSWRSVASCRPRTGTWQPISRARVRGWSLRGDEHALDAQLPRPRRRASFDALAMRTTRQRHRSIGFPPGAGPNIRIVAPRRRSRRCGSTLARSRGWAC